MFRFLGIHFVAMLCGPLITTAWHVLRLHMEEMTSRYGE